ISYNYGSRTPDSRIYLVWKRPPKLLGIVPQPEFLIQLLQDISQVEQEAADFARALNLPLEPHRRDKSKRASLPSSAPAEQASDAQNIATPSTAVGPSAPSVKGAVAGTDGPIVDLQFPPGATPPIFNAVAISDPVRKLSAVGTVAQHLANGVVRCVMLTGETG